MMRKTIFPRVLIALAVFLAALGSPSLAWSNGETALISVKPAAATVQTCSEKTIAIHVASVANLTGYHLEISFDPAVLQVTEVVNGGFLAAPGEAAFYEPTNEVDNLTGFISFGMVQQNTPGDPMTPKTGEGDLILITFEAVDWNLSSAVTIDADNSLLVDWPDAFEIPFTVANGTVDTESCAPTELELSKADVPENEPVGTQVGLLATTDPDTGDSFTYSLVDAANYPDNLAFSIDGDELRTAAVFDFEAQPAYTIKLRTTDAGGQSFDRTFIVSVTDINEGPTANADTFSTLENQTLVVAAPGVLENDTDPEDDSLMAYKLTDPPAGEGVVVFNQDGEFSYTPPTDWIGTTSFTYRVYDGEYYSQPAAVTLHVNDSNRPPTDILLDDAALPENAGADAVVGDLSTVDPDPLDSHTYDLVPGVGDTDNDLFNIAGNQLRASVDFNYEVGDQYSVRLRSTDQGGLTVEKAFTVTITDVNDHPVADAQSVDTDEEVPVDITLTGSDEDLDDLQFVLVTEPSHGALNWTPPVVTYTPDDGYYGSDSFEFKVIDEHNASSAPATVTITVHDINQSPTDIQLSNQSIFENEGVDEPIGDLSTTDQDLGDTFTYSLVAGFGDEGNGAFYIVNNQLLAAQDFNFEEQDSYSVRIRSTDSGGQHVEEVFAIEILDRNDPPVAYGQLVETVEDELVEIVLTWFDEDGDDVTFQLVTPPAEGAMPWTPPNLTYTPDNGFEGVDAFEFTVTDEHDAVSNLATITINASPKAETNYYLPIFYYNSGK
ncbi:tandem-95 repeat protein [bacterium]|nr:tandem-95 repeat protein [bacterium]